MSLEGIVRSSLIPLVSNGKMDSEETSLPKPLPQELVPSNWKNRNVALIYLPRDIWEKIIEEYLVEIPFLCDFHHVIKRSSLVNKILLSGLIKRKILADDDFDGFCESQKIDGKTLRSMIRVASLVKPIETLNLRQISFFKYSQNELFKFLMRDYDHEGKKFKDYGNRLTSLFLSIRTLPRENIVLPTSLTYLDYRSDYNKVSVFTGLPSNLFFLPNLLTLKLANLMVVDKFFELLPKTLEKIDISCCMFGQKSEENEIFFKDFPLLTELSICNTWIDAVFLNNLPISLNIFTVMNCMTMSLEPIMVSKVSLLPRGLSSLTAVVDDTSLEQQPSLNFPPELLTLTSKYNLVDSIFIKSLPKTLVKLILKAPVLDINDNFMRYLPKTLQELQLIDIKIKHWYPNYVRNWGLVCHFDLGNIALQLLSLTKLYLSGKSGEGLAMKSTIFRALPANLVEFDVYELGDEIEDIDLLFIKRNLLRLKINHNSQLSDVGIDYLPRSLLTLHLGHANISAKGIKALPRGLTSLRLSVSEISAVGIKNLPRRLTSLALKSPDLNEEQLALLPKKLKYLTLISAMTDEKMKILPRSLCYLHLPTSRTITSACIPDLPPMLQRCVPDFDHPQRSPMKFGLDKYEKEFESY